MTRKTRTLHLILLFILSLGLTVYISLLLATFFWFGVKYNLIFWPLLFISVYHLWKTHGDAKISLSRASDEAAEGLRGTKAPR